MADNNENLPPASEAVEHNLHHAAHAEALNGTVATTEAHGGPEAEHADPTAVGMNATAWVSLAMLVFILILLVKKVPAFVSKALDGKIAAIRAQLDEASKLRREAEALKAEYQAKLSGAASEIEAIRTHAEEEATQIVADAKVQATELVKRRQKMAEDKIAAAERTAIADIRTKAVQAATGAAAALIAQGHDAKADKALVDGAIKGLGTTV
ncbi:MAG: F0F1 ATP synthase subunit B [Sphingobium sp.]|nr:MAG: F0F1 ATP synthase subunit B [Sphingobium sp.]